ncbi:MAG: hypothetical protein PHR15_01495 [Atopobiaceae bacterium]|jgi:hypothetical protein|nr:hypothetical protein [Atopobiaceae bacterium]MCH4215020.1 hypothetical protein [Atopobiaceae bacterium]MCH4229871.1 hypothetical protein [Atopobiaceae bacterium]MCH4277002.1 hypothetical protein [Atopobiaceae bacterium]MCI1226114.1 hypothetical protein [Atopobiaceae bacterium]
MQHAIAAQIDGWLDGSERIGICTPVQSERMRQAMIRRVGSDVLVRPSDGLFARRRSWEALTSIEQHVLVVRTLGMLHMGWTFSHQTAAFVHGLTTSYNLLETIHVTTSVHNRQHGSGNVVRHSATKLRSERVGNIQVTPMATTVIDCCRTLGFSEGLAIADAALRSGRVTRADLEAEIRTQGRQHGIKLARITISYADGRSENGGESIARAMMLGLGYAIPDLQVDVTDPLDQGHVMRLDYLWERPDGSKVAGELDGRDKYVDPSMTGGRSTADVLLAERQRESHINALGIPVMRFQFKEVYDPVAFSAKLDAFEIPKAP